MRKRQSDRPTHTLLDELSASPVTPIGDKDRISQLTRMWDSLASIETQPNPTTDDWRILSDAVNLIETLVTMGEVQDDSGLLMDAVTALAEAGRHHIQQGHQIRLDAKGMYAVRAMLEDYSYVLERLPARTMIRCHRATEKRITDILTGKKKPHDVEVLSL